MELSDLNQDERTALIGLMKVVVMSDGSTHWLPWTTTQQ